MSDIFLSEKYYFSHVYLCKYFPLEISLQDVSLKSPITSSKVKLSATKIHLTFAQYIK